ncbi:MAG: hypothetical protein ABIN94_04150 [Ferruginibacter sp.]
MSLSETISVGSLLFAITAFVYSYLTNTKKYELTSKYRTEIIDWYSSTISILSRLATEAQDGFANREVKKELLANLSSKIDVGRFYFPNIDKGDGFGKSKPLAYRGYRNCILDFLVYSYRLYEKKNATEYDEHAETLKRHFTSGIFEIADPNSFLKETKKHTRKTFSKELSFEDFISKSPEAAKLYF